MNFCDIISRKTKGVFVMYEEKARKLDIDWKSLLVKMGILLAILFISLWVVSLFNKEKKKTESNLAVNLNSMQGAAYEYFTGTRLPEYINGKRVVTLKEMFENKLLIEFKDQNGNACNLNESYAEAIKISDVDYTIKVKLVCGDESDYIINTVKIDSIFADNPTDTPDEPNEVPDEPGENPDDNVNDKPNDDNSSNNSDNNGNQGGSNGGNSSGGSSNGGNSSGGSSNNGSSFVAVNSVYLNYKKIYLAVGASKSVSVVVNPSNATNKTVTWSSANNNIARVSEGRITGVSVGTTVITSSAGGKSTTLEVEVKDYNNVTGGNNGGIIADATCPYGNLSYNTNNVLAYKISGNCAISPSDRSYINYVDEIGLQEYLKLNNEVSKYSDAQVSNFDVIPVYNIANKGIVGYALRFSVRKRSTYTSTPVYSYYLDTYKNRKLISGSLSSLTVRPTVVNVSGISLSRSSLSLVEGASSTVYATVSPSNATNKNVSWTSSNNSVATVSSSGVVIARGVGTARITASAGGRSAILYVTVTAKNIPVSGISLNRTSGTIDVGNTLALNATVSPNNATNKNVTWSTSNSSVATVSSSGVVTGRKAGTVTITAKAGNYSRVATITVKDDTYLSVNTSSLSLYVGDIYNVRASSNKDITYRSTDSSVAYVSRSGEIKAKRVGTATITVMAGNTSRTIRVTVR